MKCVCDRNYRKKGSMSILIMSLVPLPPSGLFLTLLLLEDAILKIPQTSLP